MPKASKCAQCEQHTIEEVLPEDLSEQEEIRSNQEVFFTPNHLQVKRHR